MAEAHQAVAFSFAITHEGVHINYDTEVLNIVWLSGIRSYKKRFFGFLVSAFIGDDRSSRSRYWQQTVCR